MIWHCTVLASLANGLFPPKLQMDVIYIAKRSSAGAVDVDVEGVYSVPSAEVIDLTKEDGNVVARPQLRKTSHTDMRRHNLLDASKACPDRPSALELSSFLGFHCVRCSKGISQTAFLRKCGCVSTSEFSSYVTVAFTFS